MVHRARVVAARDQAPRAAPLLRAPSARQALARRRPPLAAAAAHGAPAAEERVVDEEIEMAQAASDAPLAAAADVLRARAGGATTAAELCAVFPYAPDAFQREAFEAVTGDERASVVVSAPTGCGKTMIAEGTAVAALAAGKRLLYTTPLKALSNQKLSDLRELFGDANVGLMTGDASINPDAPVVVMTTEILRNILYSELVDAGKGDAGQEGAEGAEASGALAAMPDDVDELYSSAGASARSGRSASPAAARESGKRSRLADVAFVVMDEVHYISDADRGTAWEETIIYLPDHVQLVCLSATVSNPHELVEWMRSVHGPTSLVTTDWRPVPLRWHFSTRSPGSLRAAQKKAARRGAGGSDTRGMGGGGRFSGRGGGAGSRKPGRGKQRSAVELPPGDGLLPLLEYRSTSAASPQVKQLMAAHAADPPEDEEDLVPSVGATLRQLRARDMLPAVWFIFSRFGCEKAAAVACEEPMVDAGERAALERALEAFDAEHPGAVRAGARGPLLNGVAAHHAGMLPSWKRFVEEQFIAGRLKVVFSTETLAAGLNMPARTAVLHTMSKRTGARTHATLGGNALLQMAGRAGRRGKDTMGHVVVRQSPFEGADAAIGVLKDGPEAMSSQFAVSYGMVLSLLRRLPPKRARALLERSFGNYLGGEGRRRAVLALDECEAALRAARRRAQAAPEAVGEQIWRKHAAARGRLQQEERAAALLRAQQAEATAGARADAVLAAYASGGAAVMLDLSGLQVDGADGGYVDQLPALLARASGGVSGATGARAACLGVDGAWYDVGAERITALVQFAPGSPSSVADAGIESPGEDSGDGVGVGEAAGDFRRAGLLRASCPGELSFSWEPVEGALAGAPCWRCENETDTAAGALEGVAEALEGDALDESAGAAGTSGANAELARAVADQLERVAATRDELASLEGATPALRAGAAAASEALREARELERRLPELRERVASYGAAGWAEFMAHGECAARRVALPITRVGLGMHAPSDARCKRSRARV